MADRYRMYLSPETSFYSRLSARLDELIDEGSNSNTMQAVDNLDNYFRTMLDERLFSNERNLRFHHRQLFDGVNLADADVLDIGSGAGLNGFYAACRGARDVVCLEPEVNGSTAGVRGKFLRIQ